MIAVILIGVSGSGKTRFAQRLLKGKRFNYINTDAYRKDLQLNPFFSTGVFNEKEELQLSAYILEQIRPWLRLSKLIVIDGLNLRRFSRQYFTDAFWDYEYSVINIYFKQNFIRACYIDWSNEDMVGFKVLDQEFKMLELPEYNDCDYYYIKEWDKKLRRVW